MLRYSAGASIFGSKVSTCVGPPPSHSHTTEVSLADLPSAAAAERPRSRPESVSPVKPSVPILRKSRRPWPSQSMPVRFPQRLNKEFPLSASDGGVRRPGVLPGQRIEAGGSGGSGA